jgi:putative membrane protein
MVPDAGAGRVPIPQRSMFGVVALGIPLSAWGAVYPPDTWLQVGPVGLGLLLAIFALRRWPISNASAACITAFLLLHLFAARWTYSNVPYDDWLKASFGFDLDRAMGWRRDMFDRLVHLSFGLLIIAPVAEIASRHAGASRPLAVFVAVFFVLGISAVYEIFEWALTMMLDPADAGAYNGEQGDPFDSQKDMACAAVGALVMIPVARRVASRWGAGTGKG